MDFGMMFLCLSVLYRPNVWVDFKQIWYVVKFWAYLGKFLKFFDISKFSNRKSKSKYFIKINFNDLGQIFSSETQSNVLGAISPKIPIRELSVKHKKSVTGLLRNFSKSN